MPSHQVLKSAIGPYTETVAAALGVTTGIVYAWQRPASAPRDTGERNDLDRVDLIRATLIESGQDPQRASLPVWWLNARAGNESIPVEPVGTVPCVLRALGDLAEASGSFQALYAAAFEDGVLSPAEKRILRGAALEHMSRIKAALAYCEGAA